MSIFCDQTIAEFIGGRGGDGAVAFRREKYVSKGGPNGGDGGKGGSIILIADENINTLADINTQKLYKAEDGGKGQKNNMHGKDGQDLIVKVPAGTLVLDPQNNQKIFDLKTHNQQFVIVNGGKGGFGNAHFKSSTHQAPNFAELGEEGEKKSIMLELQLVADVGIIGFPSAGKSTLISRISNSKPKIADYPFTTLIPNLGVVYMGKFDKSNSQSFVVADIPGLIEGAHLGKGLGHEFLRHISRTEVLVHLIDPTRNDPTDYHIINQELANYDQRLAEKEQLTVISKVDAILPEDLEDFKKRLFKLHPSLKKNTLEISSVTGHGIKELIYAMFQKVSAFRANRQEALIKDLDQSKGKEQKVFRPHLENLKFQVVFKRTKLEAASGKERKIFDVTGKRIEQVVKMTDISNPEGLERIYHFLNKMGIKNELKTLGAIPGDKIRIAGKTFLMR